MNIASIISLFKQISEKGWWGSITFEFKKGALTGTHVAQTIRQHQFEAEDVLLIVTGEPEEIIPQIEASATNINGAA